jgi:DNA-directed RNA polymerase subunit RPC12/RpoP
VGQKLNMGYLYICESCGNLKEFDRKRKLVACDVCNTLMTLRYKTVRIKKKKGHYEKLIQTLPLVGDESE